MAKPELTAPAQKPKIFVSCVTSEFAEARNLVAKALSFIGYDVEYQDAFATGAGNLTDLLRKKIDSCEGLIQIVGNEFGAESPETHPELGVLSYTQYEFIYASEIQKSTWTFFTPATSSLSEDGAEQSGEQSGVHDHPSDGMRQARYREFLHASNNLRIPFDNNLVLENSVLKIRHEFEELRSEYIEFQKSLKTGQRQTNTLLKIVLAAIPLIGLFLGALYYVSSQRQLESTKILVGKTRVAAEAVTSAKYLVKEDLFVTGRVNIDYKSGDIESYVLSVGPAEPAANPLLLGSSLDLIIDGIVPSDMHASKLGSPAAITNFDFVASKHPRLVSVTVTDQNGDVSETFEFEVDFEGAYENLRRTLERSHRKTVDNLARNTIQRYKSGGGVHCDAIDELPSHASCTFDGLGLVTVRDVLKSATIEWIGSATTLEFTFDGSDIANGLVQTSSDRATTVVFPKLAESLTVSGVFTDGSHLPKFSYEISPLRKREVRWLEPSTPDSPAVGLLSVATFGGGEWQVVPLVGDEVSSVTWSINRAPPVALKRRRAGELFESNLPKRDFGEQEKLNVKFTYNYRNLETKIFHYTMPPTDTEPRRKKSVFAP